MSTPWTVQPLKRNIQIPLTFYIPTLFPYRAGLFSKKQKKVSQFYVKGLHLYSAKHINLEKHKVWCRRPIKISLLLKLPVFVKAECSGPVGAENKHLGAALQTLL